MTLSDLEGYVSTMKDPLNTTLSNGQYTVHNGQPPASGSIVSFILAILDGMYAIAPQNLCISLYIKRRK